MLEIRYYQDPAIDSLVAVNRGICKSPAGSGKTIIGAVAIKRRIEKEDQLEVKRILWLAYTIDQIEQGKAACAAAGLINEQWTPNPYPPRITFACYAAPLDLSEYDIIICDECHHIASDEFRKWVEGRSESTIIWGLSATPERADEKADDVFTLIGPIVHEVPREDLVTSGHLAEAVVYFHAPNEQHELEALIEEEAERRAKTMEYSVGAVAKQQFNDGAVSHRGLTKEQKIKMLHWAVSLGLDEMATFRDISENLRTPAHHAILTELREQCARWELLSRARWQAAQDLGVFNNDKRNLRIIRLAADDFDMGHSILILVGSIEHGKYLQARLKLDGYDSVIAHSKMGKKKRAKTIEDFRSGALRIMIATSLADEGLDVPRANVLILGPAGRSDAKNEQRTGRVLRAFLTKEHGIIHDFWDWQQSTLMNQTYARQKTYKRLGYEIFNLRGIKPPTDEPSHLPQGADASRSVAATAQGDLMSHMDNDRTASIVNSSGVAQSLNGGGQRADGVSGAPQTRAFVDESLRGTTEPLAGDSALQDQTLPVQNFSAEKSPGEVASTADSCDKSGPVSDEKTLAVVEPKPLAHIERAHAAMSPSTLKAKAICPGFFNDQDGDKQFSERGTRGHEGVEKEDPSVAGDDVQLKKAIEWCIAYFRWILSSLPGASILREIKLRYFDQWGFCDLLLRAGSVAYLIDWKFAWNRYFAAWPQFKAYCVGVWLAYPEIETIHVHVPHPFLGDVDKETYTRTEHYHLFMVEIKAIIAAQIKNDGADFRITAQCAYCGFAGKCTKLANMGLAMGRRYAPELALPEGNLHGSEITDPAVMSALLALKKVIEKMAKGWGKAGLEMYDKGNDIPGYTMNNRGGAKSINSVGAVYNILKEHFVPDLTLDKFFELCDIDLKSAVDFVRSVAPKRGMQKAEDNLLAHLEDADAIDRGSAGRYLRAIKNAVPELTEGTEDE